MPSSISIYMTITAILSLAIGVFFIMYKNKKKKYPLRKMGYGFIISFLLSSLFAYGYWYDTD